jgi:thiamine pyrophosphokinase
MSTVVVLTGGPQLPSGVVVPPDSKVIAADGGAEIGVRPDLVVGDMDSISAATLAGIANVERHPADKDATDLELALTAALRWGREQILVVGSGGGRLDHLVGGMLLLAADDYAEVQVDAQLGTAAVHIVRSERKLHGSPGELVSLLAINGPAVGVVTDGLAYPLRAETLEPGSSRGLSNVFAAAEAQIVVGGGVVMVVRPNGSVVVGS